MLCQHDLTECTIAKFLDQIILVEPIAESLASEQQIQNFKLLFCAIEVQQSSAIGGNIDLDWVIVGDFACAVVDFEHF